MLEKTDVADLASINGKILTPLHHDVAEIDITYISYYDIFSEWSTHKKGILKYLPTATMRQCIALLDFCFGKERFCDGLCIASVRDKTFLKILYRIRNLYYIDELLMSQNGNEDHYYKVLRYADWEIEYGDYMTTAPINLNIELKRTPKADFDLCKALLVAILREDHFSNGSFTRRVLRGDVERVLVRMKYLISMGLDTAEPTSDVCSH